MCTALKQLGAEIADLQLPALGPCEIGAATPETERAEGEEGQKAPGKEGEGA